MPTVHAIHTAAPGRVRYKVEGLYRSASLKRLLGSFGLQALTFFLPWLRNLLGLNPMTLLDGLVIGAGAVGPFAVNEASNTLGQVSVTTDQPPPEAPAIALTAAPLTP